MTTSVQLLETMIDQGTMNASNLTESLANIGRGSMGQGVKEIMDQCKSLGYSNGYKLGIREGAHNAFQEFLSDDRKRIAATCVLLLDGKKGVAQKVVYGAFDLIKEKTEKEPLEVMRPQYRNAAHHDKEANQ